MDGQFFKGFELTDLNSDYIENSIFDNDLYTLKLCYKCSHICNEYDMHKKNGKNICSKCYKDKVRYSLTKNNKQLDTVSYLDKKGNKHIGKIIPKNNNIVYHSKSFITVITWINYIDNLIT